MGLELALAGYLACCIFNAWALWQAEKRNAARYNQDITRGDVVFVAFLTVCGPFSLGASVCALSNGALEKWANTPINLGKQNAKPTPSPYKEGTGGEF